MTDNPTLPSEDQTPPPSGHNNPPADLPYKLDTLNELKARTDEFVKASEVWQKTEITSEALAGQCVDQIDGLRKVWKEVDASRKEAKKPHDDAGKAVQAAYTPLLDLLKRSADALKPALAKWEDAKRKAAAEEKARRRAAAEEAERAAALAAAEAEQSGSITAQAEAEEAQKRAKEAEKAANRKIDTSTKSASGAGRTMSTRTQKVAVIENAGRLFLAVKDEPEVVEALQSVANRKVRAADFDGNLPGVRVEEKTIIA